MTMCLEEGGTPRLSSQTTEVIQKFQSSTKFLHIPLSLLRQLDLATKIANKFVRRQLLTVSRFSAF